MSEETPENPTQEPQEAPTEPEKQPEAAEPQNNDDGPQEESESAWDPERAKAKIRKLNSENKALREREAAAKEQAASVPNLESQNQSLGAENLRLRVGYELGLPIDLASRLVGSSREELVEDAEKLLDLVSPTKPAPSSGRPAPALKPGATAEVVEPPQDDSYPAHWLPQRRQ